MIDRELARRYQAAGLGRGGVLLKQSLYPRRALLDALEGARLVLDFGCGEGQLTNLLARELTRTRFAGTDLDAAKIAMANRCREEANAEFATGDFFASNATGASAVIFNDVLHHLSPPHQERAFALASRSLDGSGVLILKEVDSRDRLDVAHTTFWDRRLYPRDTLHFRTPEEWIDLAGRRGFRLVSRTTVRHPWIAARTLLVFSQTPRITLAAPAAPLSGNPARVLLTGGTGFIGGAVLRELLQHGIAGRPVEVGVITRRPWTLPPAVTVDPRVDVIEADLTRPLEPGTLRGSWDYVLHLAADVDYFGGEATYRRNLAATTNLLAALRGTPLQRFVFASTMGAIDRARLDPCRKPLDEDSPPHPTSPYGRAKVEEEKLVWESHLPWTIVRIPWCYGPGMSRSHHVRRLLGAVRADSLATRFAWPGRVSLISVEAAARSFLQAAHLRTTAGQNFFISDGEPISFGELFAAMGDSVGNPRAGRTAIPRWMLAMIRAGHFFLPFTLKALVADALHVSAARAKELGLVPPARPPRFLNELVRYDARENWPNRERQVALVTGAASGIGLALARHFHAQGHQLCLVDRNETELAAVAHRLGAHAHAVDLAQLDPANAVGQLSGSLAAKVAIVVNNAGLGYRGGYAQLEPAAVHRMLAVNIDALVASTGGFAREMGRHGGGTIVNIASSSSFQPLPYMAAYAASKAFVWSYTLAVGAERDAPPGVRVLAVSPSGTKTNFQAAGAVKTNEKEKLLRPEDIAAAVLRAIDERAPATIVGTRGLAMSLFARLAPTRTLVRLWEKLMRVGR